MSATEAVFNGKTMTRREVEIARDAFVRGWKEYQGFGAIDEEDCYEAAKRLFPLPKVTRPRVVQGPYGYYYRVIDGRLEESRRKHKAEEFIESDLIYLPDVPTVAELIANPNETVEE